MANAEELIINLKAVMDINDIKSNVNQIQNVLSKLKLPDDLGRGLSKNIEKVGAETEKATQLMEKGFTKASDVSKLDKSLKSIDEAYKAILQDVGKIDNDTLQKALTFDTGPIADLQKQWDKLKASFDEKIQTSGLEEVKKQVTDINTVSKSKQFGEFLKQFQAGNIESATAALQNLSINMKSFGNETFRNSAGFADFITNIDNLTASLSKGDLDTASTQLKTLIDSTSSIPAGNEKIKTYAEAIENLLNHLKQLSSGDVGLDQIINDLQEIGTSITAMKSDQIDRVAASMHDIGNSAETSSAQVKTLSQSLLETAKSQTDLNNQISQLASRAVHFTSLINGVQLFKKSIKEAYEEVKALDKAMTETAVVTDFSVGDMWDKLPEYTDVANKYGAAIKDAYEVMTIFYQQGLDTNQAFALGEQTMQMARIAGLDYANAADKMTNALRGFNMELNETSAQKVNDVYSELAAISASDTKELATAMTKVASLANSANMEFENTAAFLAQMIETTRESAETAGTALKTVVARFAEVKGLYSEGDLVGNVDGEEVNINKVGEALRAAGIDLNEFMVGAKGLDDILLELSSKWDSLDLLTQRYIATMAAGSRQQSRFLALMSDNARLTELTSAAYAAQGASAEQFAKTQDSLETKINKLKNAWDEFVMGLANASVFKKIIDTLTGLLTVINNVFSVFEKLGTIGNIGRSAASIGLLVSSFLALKTIIDNAIRKIAILRSELAGTTVSSQQFVGVLGNLANIITKIRTAKIGGEIKLTPMLDTSRITSEWAALKKSLGSKEELIDAAGSAADMVAKKAESAAIAENSEKIAENTAIQKANNKEHIDGAGASAANAAAKKYEKGDFNKGIKEGWKKGLENWRKDDDPLNPRELEDLRQENLLNKELFGDDWDDDMDYSGIKTVGQLRKRRKAEGGQKIIDLDTKGFGEQFSDSFKGQFDKEKKGLKELGSVGKKSLDGIKTNFTEIATKAATFLATNAETIGVLAAVAVQAAAVAAVVAVTALAFKAMYENSPGQKLEKDIANQKAEIERLNEELTKTEEQLNTCNQAWETLTNTDLSSLTEGTIEWYQALQKANSAAQEIIDSLNLIYGTDYTIDEKTGKYIIDENRYQNIMTDKYKQQINTQQALALDKANLNYNQQMKNIREKNDVSTFSTIEGSANYNRLFETNEEWSKRSNAMNAELKLAKTQLSNQYASLYASNANSLYNDSKKTAAGKLVANQTIEANISGDSIKSLSEQFLDSTNKGIGKYGTLTKGEYEALTSESFEDLGKSGKTSKKDFEQLKETMESQSLYDGVNYTDKINKNTLEIDGQSYEVKRKKGKNDGDNVITWAQANQLLLNKAATNYGTNQFKNNKNFKIAQKELFGNQNLADMINGEIKANLNEVNWDSLSDEFKKAFYSGKDGKDKFDQQKQSIKDKRIKVSDNINNAGIVNIDSSNSQVNWNTVQKSIEAAKKSIEAFGETGSTALTSIILGLEAIENANQGISFEAQKDFFEKIEESGVTAEDFRNTINSIDFTNSIKGAQQLREMISKGGAEEIKANLILGVDQEDTAFFGEVNQIKEALSESTKDGSLQSQLMAIVQAEGEITTDNLEELTEDYSQLKTILDDDVVSETALARIMTEVGKEEIRLTDITDDLVQTISLMTNSFDLAADAMERLKSIEVGDDLTEIGKTLTGSRDSVQDLLKRGAAGNTQIDDYMAQIIGEKTWTTLMNDAGGDRSTAYEQAKKQYGVDKIDGNLYGSWKAMIGNLDEDNDLSQIFSLQNGKIKYDLTGRSSTDVIDLMAETWFNGDKDTAKMYYQDMSTYSKDFAQATEAEDRKAGIKKFVNDHYDKDEKTITATESEWKMMRENDGEYQKNGSVTIDGKVYKKDTNGHWFDSASNQITDEKLLSQIDTSFNSTEAYQTWLGNDLKLTQEGKSITPTMKTTYAGGLVALNDDKKVELTSKATENKESAINKYKTKKGDAVTKELETDEEYQKAEKNNVSDAGLMGKLKRGALMTGAMLMGLSYQEAKDGTQYSRDNEAERDKKMKEASQKKEDAKAEKETAVKELAKSFQDEYTKIVNDSSLDSDQKDQAIEDLKELYLEAANEGETNEEEKVTEEDLTQDLSDTLSANMLTGDEMATSVYSGVINAFATLVGKGLFANDVEDPDEFSVDVVKAGQEVVNATTTVNVDGEGQKVSTDTAVTQNVEEPVEVDFNSNESGSVKKTPTTGVSYPKGSDSSNGGSASGKGSGGGSGDSEDPLDKQLEALKKGGIWTSLAQLKILEKQKENLFKQYGLQKKTLTQRLKEIGIIKDTDKTWIDLLDKISDGSATFGDVFSAIKESLPSLEDLDFKSLLSMPKDIIEEIKNDNGFGGATKELDDEFWEKLNKYNEAEFEVFSELIDEGTELTSKGIDISSQLADSAIQMIEAFAQAAVDGFNSYLGWMTMKIDDEHDIEQLDSSLSNIVDRLAWEYDKLLKRRVGYDGTDTLNEKELFENSNQSAKNIMARMQNQRRLYENSFRQLEDLGLNISSELTEAFEKLYDQLYGVNGPFTRLNKSINRFKGQLEDVFPSTSKFLGEAKGIVGNLFQDGKEKIDGIFEKIFPSSIFNDLIDSFTIDGYQLGDFGKEKMQKLIELFTELTPSFNADYQIANKSELVDALNQKMSTIITNDTITAQFVQGYLDYLTEVESQMESEVENIRNSESQILELYDNLTEILERGKEEYSELGQDLFTAITDEKNSLLEELQALHDSITAADEDILETLRNNLELIRQQRENDKTEQDLQAKEARLAYLRQDTTGANLQEIKELEKELEDGQESYTDKLIDQKISELEKQNTDAADQRQIQIDLLQEEINNTEGIWETVEKLLSGISKFDHYLTGEIDREGYKAVIEQLKKGQSYIDSSSTDKEQSEKDWNAKIRAASLYKQVQDNLSDEYNYLKLASNIIDRETGLPEEYVANGGWNNYVAFSTLETTVDKSNQLLQEAITAVNNLVEKITVSYDDEQSLHMKATYYGGLVQAVSGTESAAKAAIEDLASGAPEILNQLTEGTGNMTKGFLKLGLSVADTSWAAIVTAIKSNFATGGGAASTSLGNVGEGLGFLMEGISNYVSAAADAASLGMQMAGDMAPGITDIGVALATALKETFFNDYEKVEDDLIENIDVIVDKLGNTLGTSGYLKEIKDAIKLSEKIRLGQPDDENSPIYDALTEMYQDLLKDYRQLENNENSKTDVEGYNKLYLKATKLREMLNGMVNYSNGFTEEVNELDPAASLETLQKWRGEIGTLFKQIDETVRGNIISIVNGIMAMEGKTLGESKISRWIDIYDGVMMSDVSTQTLQRLAVAMEEFEPELSNKLYKLYNDRWTAENTPQETFFSFWSNKVTGIWGDVQDFFDGFWNKITQSFQTVVESITGKNYEDSWIGKLNERINAFIEKLKSGSLLEAIKSLFDSDGDGKVGLNEIIRAIFGKGTDGEFFTELGSFFGDLVKEATIGGLWNNINSFFSGLLDGIKDNIESILEGVLDLNETLSASQANFLNETSLDKLKINFNWDTDTPWNTIYADIINRLPPTGEGNPQKVNDFLQVLEHSLLHQLLWRTLNKKGIVDNLKSSYGINSFATGGSIRRSQTALVGEAGTELIQHARGGATLATSPSMAKLEKGDVVYNAKQTKDILKGGGLDFSRFAEGTVSNFMLREPSFGYSALKINFPDFSETNKESTFNLNLNLEDLVVDSVDRVEEVAERVMDKINTTISGAMWPYNRL